MGVASILCVDDELDVHDTASAAVAAALERRRELPTARIGLAVGDLEAGDPLGFAKRLAELADPGTILVTDSVRRAVARDDHAFVDLGAISASGYLDRVHVFELGGATTRRRTVLAIGLVQTVRVVAVGTEEDDRAHHEAQLREYDRRIFRTAFLRRGFVERVDEVHLLAFSDPADAFRAAISARKNVDLQLGMLEIGIETAVMRYSADRWTGSAWGIASRIRAGGRRLASTMTAVEAVGQPALRDLGLVIEVVEEVVHKGVRDLVRVAQLRQL